jgi:hypothetical protein
MKRWPRARLQRELGSLATSPGIGSARSAREIMDAAVGVCCRGRERGGVREHGGLAVDFYSARIQRDVGLHHRKEHLLVACAHRGGRRSCARRSRLSGARIYCSVGDFHDRWVPRGQSGRLCAGPRIYRSNAPTAHHATIAMMTFVTKTAKASNNRQPHLSSPGERF